MRPVAALASLATAIVVTAVSSGCRREATGMTTRAPPAVTGATIAAVAIATVPEEIEAVGTVRARTSALVSARIPGTVTAVHVREGDRVPAGRTLVTIESTETAAGAAGAAAGVEEARRGVEEAASRQRLAETTFTRYEKLLAEGVVARQEYDSRKAEREMAAESLARARARLAQAEQQRRSAAAVAGYGRVASPVAGLITLRSVEPGTTVFRGTPLVTVEEQGHYRLEAAAPEAAVTAIRTGSPARVSIEGLGDRDGRVAEVLPSSDPATRTVTVKIDLPGEGLRSGMYGKALFRFGDATALVVPKSALATRGALAYVWALDREGRARMRLVKPGRTVAGNVEILAGLSTGEKIVAAGIEKVTEGALAR
jgi:RND family efflux transporter MFP subunit